ncbi:hypothetical protein AOLI_G00315600 [Acnodon oligacanthus]
MQDRGFVTAQHHVALPGGKTLLGICFVYAESRPIGYCSLVVFHSAWYKRENIHQELEADRERKRSPVFGCIQPPRMERKRSSRRDG